VFNIANFPQSVSVKNFVKDMTDSLDVCFLVCSVDFRQIVNSLCVFRYFGNISMALWNGNWKPPNFHNIETKIFG